MGQHLEVCGSLFHVNRGVLKAHGLVSGQSADIPDFAAKTPANTSVTDLVHSLRQGVVAVFFQSETDTGHATCQDQGQASSSHRTGYTAHSVTGEGVQSLQCGCDEMHSCTDGQASILLVWKHA